jgi:D-3-phosphoglycerate dehydrogenase
MILTIKTDKENLFIAGTVFNDNVGRVVIIDKFYTDMIPQGTFLYFKNDDRPGVIGKVGTILGDNGINIAGFELSRQEDNGAMAFVSVDNDIDNTILEQILNIDGMFEAKVVNL